MWGVFVKGYIEERAMEIARYIIDNNATVRQAAKKYGISKSTVHAVVHHRTPQTDQSGSCCKDKSGSGC